MSLIKYQLPDFEGLSLPTGVVRYNRRLHKRGRNYVGHAHFLKGVLVYDESCGLCKGIKKPPKSAAEIAEKKRLRFQYYLAWKNSHSR